MSFNLPHARRVAGALRSIAQPLAVIVLTSLLALQLEPPYLYRVVTADGVVLLAVFAMLAVLSRNPAVRMKALRSVSVQQFVKPLAVIAGSVYGLCMMLSVSTLIMEHSLNRSFNLLLDMRLAIFGFDVLSGSLGTLLAWLCLVSLVLLIVFFSALLSVSLLGFFNTLRSLPSSSSRWRGAGSRIALVTAGLFAVSVLDLVRSGPQLPTSLVWQVADRQLSGYARAQASLKKLQQQLATAPPAAVSLPRLENRNILLTFVESYGVSAVLDEPFASTLGPRLAAVQEQLESAGLYVATGRMQSPVQGGQSWLAHATMISGLWIDDQISYDLLMSSKATTLIDDFALTGHDTLAVMPAITIAWPDGARLGYDHIAHSRNMQYAGKPLNWVTMPDQYTLSWLRNTLAEKPDSAVFAELALISSHAPWTPILPVLEDWDAVSDGSVFDVYLTDAETPESLWKDSERVKTNYGLALDYSLAVVADYASKYLEDGLMVVLGDHQAAPLIIGENASRDVPVHLMSGDAALINDLIRTGHFQAGMGLPAKQGFRMDAFRGVLHDLGSEPGRQVADAAELSHDEG